MVECGANEIPEDVMVEALELGHKSIQPLIDLQFQMQAEVGKAKRDTSLALPDAERQKKFFERVSGPMTELLDKPLTKNEFYGGMTTLKDEVVAELCTAPDAGSGTVGVLPTEFPVPASVREDF